MRHFGLILVSLTIIFIGTSSFRGKINGNEESISLKVTIKAPTTETSKDGELKLEFSGGTAPYEVRCMGPDINSKSLENNNLQIKKLIKGNYLIIVRDQNGLLKHQEVQL